MTRRASNGSAPHRREFALAAGSALALLPGLAIAQGAHHGHGAHGAQPAAKGVPKAAPGGAPAKYQPVLDAARACEVRGSICRRHCLRLIRKGDNSLQECLKLVEAMLPVCATTAAWARADARRFKELAKLCLDVCTDCEAECKKHAGHHAECKACMEACQGMIAALKTVLAA